MGMSSGKKGSYMGDINVTPLVDVMLVLLIIFMVTAPMMTKGLDVKLPDAQAKAIPQKKEPVVISVNEKGAIFLKDKPVSEGTLTLKLTEMKSQGKTDQVLLMADRDASYGVVARVVAAVREAGIEDLGLVTEPTERETPKKASNRHR